MAKWLFQRYLINLLVVFHRTCVQTEHLLFVQLLLIRYALCSSGHNCIGTCVCNQCVKYGTERQENENFDVNISTLMSFYR
jgi:hypothetical protein